jgi:hypothetical protein
VQVLFLLPRVIDQYADEQQHTQDTVIRVRGIDASTPMLQIRPVPSRITSPSHLLRYSRRALSCVSSAAAPARNAVSSPKLAAVPASLAQWAVAQTLA